VFPTNNIYFVAKKTIYLAPVSATKKKEREKDTTNSNM
jgi:hypothetical protein